jgi:hypothetical protein
MAQAGSNGTPKLNDKNSVSAEPHARETAPETEAALDQDETDYTVLRPKNLQPGVNRLPLDGTPCIVPDADKIAPMPNAWKGPLRVPFKKKKPVALYNESSAKPVLN